MIELVRNCFIREELKDSGVNHDLTEGELSIICDAMVQADKKYRWYLKMNK